MFQPSKISHYPFWSVPLPEVYVNTQQDPISKLKTSTSQALPMGENKQSPHLRRSPWAMDSHMIKAATKCWNWTPQNWIRRQNKDFAKNRLLIIANLVMFNKVRPELDQPPHSEAWKVLFHHIAQNDKKNQIKGSEIL